MLMDFLHNFLISNNQTVFFVFKILFNISVVYIITFKIFRKYNKTKNFLFTYNLMGLTTFLLCYLLSDVKLDIGFSLGLFAILTIIRFRTVNISTKRMTYLFVVVGISVINSLVSINNLIILLISNLILIIFLITIENKTILINEKED